MELNLESRVYRVLRHQQIWGHRSGGVQQGRLVTVCAALTESEEHSHANHWDADKKIRDEKQNLPAETVYNKSGDQCSNNLNGSDQHRTETVVDISSSALRELMLEQTERDCCLHLEYRSTVGEDVVDPWELLESHQDQNNTERLGVLFLGEEW